MSTKASIKQSKLTQYIKAPYRALRHARDMYESGMAGIAGKAQRGGPIMALPRSRGFGHQSRTSGSSEEEIDELIRAACNSKMRAIPIKEDGTLGPRSHSVATMRIDEDQPCYFEEDLKVALGPRSRSYAVGATKKTGF